MLILTIVILLIIVFYELLKLLIPDEIQSLWKRRVEHYRKTSSYDSLIDSMMINDAIDNLETKINKRMKRMEYKSKKYFRALSRKNKKRKR